MVKMALHWKILLGMLLGVGIGWLGSRLPGGLTFIQDWIKPVGQIFINLLKVIAVPLVIVSLAKGIADLKSIANLSRIGGRTIFWFLATTLAAVIIGLVLVNVFAPGDQVSATTVAELSQDYTSVVTDKIEQSGGTQDKGPLDFFVRLVPQNIFQAMDGNGNMLQVIFFTLFFSICLLMLPEDRQKPLHQLFDVTNEVLLKMIHLIMQLAPYAVLALIAALVAETSNGELFMALLQYALVLLFGMVLILGMYGLLIRFFSNMKMSTFYRGILPAQLVAFSTSSSMATLPVTMEVAEEELGVDNQIASFVCPVGATINMDATSLMQGLAAVFICQVMGHELSFGDQLVIVVMATLASIGAAGAPSAGIVMLIIVLDAVGFPSEKLPIALAMILAIDRPLDMCRTVINISGDLCVSVLVKSANLARIG